MSAVPGISSRTPIAATAGDDAAVGVLLRCQAHPSNTRRACAIEELDLHTGAQHRVLTDVRVPAKTPVAVSGDTLVSTAAPRNGRVHRYVLTRAPSTATTMKLGRMSLSAIAGAYQEHCALEQERPDLIELAGA